MIDISDLTGTSRCADAEYPLSLEDEAKLRFLAEELDLKIFKSFLSNEGMLKLLVFDVETSKEDRDDVQLVGVLVYPDLKVYQFDHKLTRLELEGLIGAADTVVFAAFNYGFDLVRSFGDDAKDILLRRTTKFGDTPVSYRVLKKEDVASYALDIQKLANNLISDKKRSLKQLSEDNQHFHKISTDDFLDRSYNAYDLLSEFELLVRAQVKAKLMLDTIGFKPEEIIDFITKQSRYEPIESHMAPIKLFESGSRLAKTMVAPYARFPSLPAFFAGARVCAFEVGDMGRDWYYCDINSEYPSIISRMSPNTMELCYGDEAVRIANGIKQALIEECPEDVFKKYYVDQDDKALLLSSWVLVGFKRNLKLRVESLEEKAKKGTKLSSHTLIYRNKRQEQRRAEGYATFRQGSVVNIPFYFLFLQSPEDLKAIRIIGAVGFSIRKDESWRSRWESLYQLRADNPELKTALKVALNATYGLSVDVDQPFSNLALGAHITAFSRTVAFIVERSLGNDILYTDTDGFVCRSSSKAKLNDLMMKLAPFGAKEEFPDGEELVIFRTKRYAVRAGESWTIKGAEKLGGREKNKISSYLAGSERSPIDDIRQSTKKSKTPNIPAVGKLLANSETGEWCYYFSYPEADLAPGLMETLPEGVVSETTKSGTAYFASKSIEPLKDLASKMSPLPSAKMSFVKSDTKKIIPAEVFAPLIGNVDTTFLKAQVSLAGLMHLPIKRQDKMRLIARTIGAMGKSDNRGVKIGVETLKVAGGKLTKIEPQLKPLPRRSRKKKPFAQRRFYIRQTFPYEITYHLSQDAIDDLQYRSKKFVVKHPPVWTLGQMAGIIDTFLKDLKMLEDRFNEVLREEIGKSGNLVVLSFYGDAKIGLTPYARYTRFDVSLDIPQEAAIEYIEDLEAICKRERIDYHKGLGYIGIKGRDLSNSNYFMPANIVIYDRNARFDKHAPHFLRKYRPFVEEWKNDRVGRVEIQTFAHKSNNRKTNPLASVLNALEILKIQAPEIFEFLVEVLKGSLSVITHMFPDPAFGSGPAGQDSSTEAPHDTKNHPIIPVLGGFVPWAS
jgi:hypothetical protein